MCFRPFIDPISIRPYKAQNKGYFYKCNTNADVKLIRYFLEDNGFRECTKRENEFSVYWSCSNIKS
jgi:hypothetical protein